MTRHNYQWCPKYYKMVAIKDNGELFKHRAPYFVSSCNFLQTCPGSGMRYDWNAKHDYS